MALFGNTRQYDEMEGTEIDRKRKKDPGLAFFFPRVFATGTSTVRRGKKLDDETH